MGRYLSDSIALTHSSGLLSSSLSLVVVMYKLGELPRPHHYTIALFNPLLQHHLMIASLYPPAPP
jgi:hypothetical protein